MFLLFMPPWPTMRAGLPERDARAYWVLDYADAIERANSASIKGSAQEDMIALAKFFSEMTFTEAANDPKGK